MDYRYIVQSIIDSHKSGKSINILQASKKYDCSVSSIRKYIAKIKRSENEYDRKLYSNYLEVAKTNQKNGRINGGKIGKRTTNYSQEQIEKIFELITENDYTLRQLEDKLGIPSSTIYEILMKYLEKSKRLIIQEIFERHKKNLQNNYENDTENSREFHKVGTEMANQVIKFRK